MGEVIFPLHIVYMCVWVYIYVCMCVCNAVCLKKNLMNKQLNKKHSENADTSTSVTFDLELRP